MSTSIPVILFAYARPDHLTRTLDCLQVNRVPLIYAFSDGPRTPDKLSQVTEVRRILRSVDWCKIIIHERDTNWGLGRSILSGVTEVLQQHKAAIVFEDDLVCVPGTYDYLCAALEHYQNIPCVMSVTGWVHPIVTPGDITDQPYFDGRAECWVWGTWDRVWHEIVHDAMALMRLCREQGIDIYRYGTDLKSMAEIELQQNIWAVRFLYWHILNRGLCVRPPWSMVEHIGFDSQATNFGDAGIWANPPLKSCPPIPLKWPVAEEHKECARLWQLACGQRPSFFRRAYRFARSWVLGVGK